MPRLAVIDAAIFGAQISAADVVQGALGTCYLHAGLSAMAFARPDLVRQMFDVNPETGEIAIRFVRDGVAVWVPVDRRFYVYETGDGSRMAYALAEPGQPLWPAFVEKAWAIHQGGALGYAGVVGGNSGAVATALRPVVTVTSQGRAQPSRGVDDGNFAHPMSLGPDALADLIIAANDSTVTAAAALAIAHTVLDLEHEWLAWTKSWLSSVTWSAENAIREVMGYSTVDRETWLRNNNVRTGVGFRTFLAEKFGRDWATAEPVLAPVIALMTTWESGTELDDTHQATRVLTRWAGDRVKALLTRGDAVMVATNPTSTGTNHPITDLQPDHAYTVIGLRSDPADPSYVTHLLLRNPNGTATDLSVRHFNQLLFISSAGPATQFVLGDGELALTVLPSSIQTRQPWAIDPPTLLADQPTGAQAAATAVAHTVDIVGELGGRQRPRPRYQRPPKLPSDLDANGSLTAATTRARQAAHWWERHGRAWWAALRFDELTDADQYRLVTEYHRLRKSDGLPVRVRDTMNRGFLRHELARSRASAGTGKTATANALRSAVLTRFDRAVATADAEAAALAGRSAIAAPRAFLLRVEPSAFDGTGSLVLSIGNPITASVLTWHVPGETVAPTAAAKTGVELYAATAQELAGSRSTATIVWLDRAAIPKASVANWIKSAVAAAPRDGKARLESAMAALRTGRVQRGGRAPHIEVVDDMWGTPSARSSRAHPVDRPINHLLAQPRSWPNQLTTLGRDEYVLFGSSGRPDVSDLAPDGVEPHAAALRALIARHPGWIAQLVRERADGNFEVVFHRADGTVARVAVDRQFPVVNGNADYRAATPGQPLWPAVLAKALAVYQDNEPAADLLGESSATETGPLPGYRAGEPTAIPAALTPPHGWNPAGQLSSLTGTTQRVLTHPMYLSPELLRALYGADIATVLTTRSRRVAPVVLWDAVAFAQSEHDVWEQARAAFARAPDPARAVGQMLAWLAEYPSTAERAFDRLLRDIYGPGTHIEIAALRRLRELLIRAPQAIPLLTPLFDAIAAANTDASPSAALADVLRRTHVTTADGFEKFVQRLAGAAAPDLRPLLATMRAWENGVPQGESALTWSAGTFIREMFERTSMLVVAIKPGSTHLPTVVGLVADSAYRVESIVVDGLSRAVVEIVVVDATGALITVPAHALNQLASVTSYGYTPEPSRTVTVAAPSALASDRVTLPALGSRPDESAGEHLPPVGIPRQVITTHPPFVVTGHLVEPRPGGVLPVLREYTDDNGNELFEIDAANGRVNVSREQLGDYHFYWNETLGHFGRGLRLASGDVLFETDSVFVGPWQPDPTRVAVHTRRGRVWTTAGEAHWLRLSRVSGTKMTLSRPALVAVSDEPVEPLPDATLAAPPDRPTRSPGGAVEVAVIGANGQHWVTSAALTAAGYRWDQLTGAYGRIVELGADLALWERERVVVDIAADHGEKVLLHTEIGSHWIDSTIADQVGLRRPDRLAGPIFGPGGPRSADAAFLPTWPLARRLRAMTPQQVMNIMRYVVDDGRQVTAVRADVVAAVGNTVDGLGNVVDGAGAIVVSDRQVVGVDVLLTIDGRNRWVRVDRASTMPVSNDPNAPTWASLILEAYAAAVIGAADPVLPGYPEPATPPAMAIPAALAVPWADGSGRRWVFRPGTKVAVRRDPVTDQLMMRSPGADEQWQPAAEEAFTEAVPVLRTVDTPLFGPTIDAADVRQGRAGTCYLLADLISLANTNPQWIARMITELPDNAGFAVRFTEPDGSTTTIVVDRQFYTFVDANGAESAYAATDRALWPAVIEKAWAVYRGAGRGYAGIYGGQPGAAADTLRPPQPVGERTGRAQAIRAVDDHYFAHPMTMSLDALTDLLGDQDAARAILGWESDWRTILPTRPELATSAGFVAFLGERSAEHEVPGTVLATLARAMDDWESTAPQEDSVLTRWVGDRIAALFTPFDTRLVPGDTRFLDTDAVLSSGDILTVQTKPIPVGQERLLGRLRGSHAYAVAGVTVEDIDGTPVVTYVRLIDPHDGAAIEVRAAYFNRFRAIGSAGSRTAFVMGADDAPIPPTYPPAAGLTATTPTPGTAFPRLTAAQRDAYRVVVGADGLLRRAGDKGLFDTTWGARPGEGRTTTGNAQWHQDPANRRALFVVDVFGSMYAVPESAQSGPHRITHATLLDGAAAVAAAEIEVRAGKVRTLVDRGGEYAADPTMNARFLVDDLSASFRRTTDPDHFAHLRPRPDVASEDEAVGRPKVTGDDQLAVVPAAITAPVVVDPPVALVPTGTVTHAPARRVALLGRRVNAPATTLLTDTGVELRPISGGLFNHVPGEATIRQAAGHAWRWVSGANGTGWVAETALSAAGFELRADIGRFAQLVDVTPATGGVMRVYAAERLRVSWLDASSLWVERPNGVSFVLTPAEAARHGLAPVSALTGMLFAPTGPNVADLPDLPDSALLRQLRRLIADPAGRRAIVAMVRHVGDEIDVHLMVDGSPTWVRVPRATDLPAPSWADSWHGVPAWAAAILEAHAATNGQREDEALAFSDAEVAIGTNRPLPSYPDPARYRTLSDRIAQWQNDIRDAGVRAETTTDSDAPTIPAQPVARPRVWDEEGTPAVNHRAAMEPTPLALVGARQFDAGEQVLLGDATHHHYTVRINATGSAIEVVDHNDVAVVIGSEGIDGFLRLRALTVAWVANPRYDTESSADEDSSLDETSVAPTAPPPIPRATRPNPLTGWREAQVLDLAGTSVHSEADSPFVAGAMSSRLVSAATGITVHAATAGPTTHVLPGTRTEPQAQLPVSMPTAVVSAPRGRLVVSTESGALATIDVGKSIPVSQTWSDLQGTWYEIESFPGYFATISASVLAAAFTEHNRGGKRLLRAKVHGLVVATVEGAAHLAPGSRIPLRLNPADPNVFEIDPGDGRWLRSSNPFPLNIGSARATGPLFGIDGRVLPTDVKQGAVGDCYLMSALINLATHSPDMIADMVTETVGADGARTFSVRFNDPEQGWVWVKVDDTFYTDSAGAMKYAAHTSGQPLWPAVIEKAWAAYHGRDHGYHGAEVGLPGATAGKLRPSTVVGDSGRVQPTRSVDEMVFAWPLQFDQDLLAELIGDHDVAHWLLASAQAPSSTNTTVPLLDRVRAAAAAAVTAVTEVIAREGLSRTITLTAAEVTDLFDAAGLTRIVTSAQTAWQADPHGHTTFAAFVADYLDSALTALEDQVRAWRSGRTMRDITVARWLAKRTQYLIERGDTVTANTKSALPRNPIANTLFPKHAYSVVRVVWSGGVERSGSPTGLVVVDPYSPATQLTIPLANLNMFSAMSSSGPGTHGAFGVTPQLAAPTAEPVANWDSDSDSSWHAGPISGFDNYAVHSEIGSVYSLDEITEPSLPLPLPIGPIALAPIGTWTSATLTPTARTVHLSAPLSVTTMPRQEPFGLATITVTELVELPAGTSVLLSPDPENAGQLLVASDTQVYVLPTAQASTGLLRSIGGLITAPQGARAEDLEPFRRSAALCALGLTEAIEQLAELADQPAHLLNSMIQSFDDGSIYVLLSVSGRATWVRVDGMTGLPIDLPLSAPIWPLLFLHAQQLADMDSASAAVFDNAVAWRSLRAATDHGSDLTQLLAEVPPPGPRHTVTLGTTNAPVPPERTEDVYELPGIFPDNDPADMTMSDDAVADLRVVIGPDGLLYRATDGTLLDTTADLGGRARMVMDPRANIYVSGISAATVTVTPATILRGEAAAAVAEIEVVAGALRLMADDSTEYGRPVPRINDSSLHYLVTELGLVVSDDFVQIGGRSTVVAHDTNGQVTTVPAGMLTIPAAGLTFVSAGRSVSFAGGAIVAVRLDQARPGEVALAEPTGAWHWVGADLLVANRLPVLGLVEVDNPLFGATGRPLPGDVVQGAAGTCGVLAVLIGVAQTHPEMIERMIRVEGDGYAVRFFDNGQEKPTSHREVWVPVDRNFYTFNGTSAYAAHRQGHPLWPALIEKAWALYQGKERGYAGVYGNDEQRVAGAIWPRTVIGRWTGRAQGVQAVGDPSFAHPMTLGVDALTELLGNAALARRIAGFENRWSGWTDSWRDASSWKRATDELARLRADQSVTDPTLALTAWLKTQNASTWTGLSAMLVSALGVEAVRTMGAGLTKAERAALVEQLGAAEFAAITPALEPLRIAMEQWASTDPLTDTVIARWVGERIARLLSHGDTVTLSTRATAPGLDYLPHTMLRGHHAHTVVGVERDAVTGEVVGVLLADPHGSRGVHPGAIVVPLRHLNQFARLASAGTGTRAAYGKDAPRVQEIMTYAPAKGVGPDKRGADDEPTPEPSAKRQRGIELPSWHESARFDLGLAARLATPAEVLAGHFPAGTQIAFGTGNSYLVATSHPEGIVLRSRLDPTPVTLPLDEFVALLDIDGQAFVVVGDTEPVGWGQTGTDIGPDVWGPDGIPGGRGDVGALVSLGAMTVNQRVFLRTQQLRAIEVDADGDCFYRAVVRAMPAHLRPAGDEATAITALRQRLAEVARTSLRALPQGENYTDADVERIAVDLATTGRWAVDAGDLAPILVAIAYDLRVFVVTEQGVPRQAHQQDSVGVAGLWLLRTGENHYRNLVRESQSFIIPNVIELTDDSSDDDVEMASRSIQRSDAPSSVTDAPADTASAAIDEAASAIDDTASTATDGTASSVGEDIGPVRVRATSTTFPHLADRADARVVVGADGLLRYTTTGALVDTTAAPSGWLPIVTDRLSVTFVPTLEQAGHASHAALLDGGAANAAAEIMVDQGVLVALSDRGGEYPITAEHNDALLAELRRAGLRLADDFEQLTPDPADPSFDVDRTRPPTDPDPVRATGPRSRVAFSRFALATIDGVALRPHQDGSLTHEPGPTSRRLVDGAEQVFVRGARGSGWVWLNSLRANGYHTDPEDTVLHRTVELPVNSPETGPTVLTLRGSDLVTIEATPHYEADEPYLRLTHAGREWLVRLDLCEMFGLRAPNYLRGRPWNADGPVATDLDDLPYSPDLAALRALVEQDPVAIRRMVRPDYDTMTYDVHLLVDGVARWLRVERLTSLPWADEDAVIWPAIVLEAMAAAAALTREAGNGNSFGLVAPVQAPPLPVVPAAAMPIRSRAGVAGERFPLMLAPPLPAPIANPVVYPPGRGPLPDIRVPSMPIVWGGNAYVALSNAQVVTDRGQVLRPMDDETFGHNEGQDASHTGPDGTWLYVTGANGSGWVREDDLYDAGFTSYSPENQEFQRRWLPAGAPDGFDDGDAIYLDPTARHPTQPDQLLVHRPENHELARQAAFWVDAHDAARAGLYRPRPLTGPLWHANGPSVEDLIEFPVTPAVAALRELVGTDPAAIRAMIRVTDATDTSPARIDVLLAVQGGPRWVRVEPYYDGELEWPSTQASWPLLILLANRAATDYMVDQADASRAEDGGTEVFWNGRTEIIDGVDHYDVRDPADPRTRRLVDDVWLAEFNARLVEETALPDYAATSDDQRQLAGAPVYVPGVIPAGPLRLTASDVDPADPVIDLSTVLVDGAWRLGHPLWGSSGPLPLARTGQEGAAFAEHRDAAAQLSALAAERPEIIRASLRENPDNRATDTVEVRLVVDGRPRWVRVNRVSGQWPIALSTSSTPTPVWAHFVIAAQAAVSRMELPVAQPITNIVSLAGYSGSAVLSHAWLAEHHDLVQPQADVAPPSYRPDHVGSSSPHRAPTQVGLGVARGELYNGSTPRPTDVRQGGVADCYLLANLIGLAEDNPTLITDMITEDRTDGERTFTVRFHDPRTGGPTWVTVDDTFPVDADGQMIYAAHDEHTPLWAAVIEKAWAQLRGDGLGYAGIAMGALGDAAEWLRPPFAEGAGGRRQPTRAIDAPLAATALHLDLDTMADLIGSVGVARMVANWSTGTLAELTVIRDAAAAGAVLDAAMGAVVTGVTEAMRTRDLAPDAITGLDRAALIELFGDEAVAEAIAELLPVWSTHPRANDLPTFAALLSERWGAATAKLVAELAAWESTEALSADPAKRWLADRIDYLLDRGDTVNLGTKAVLPEQLANELGLRPAHGYSVAAVLRTGGRRSEPVAIVLRDPLGGSEITVAMDRANLFSVLGTAGPGTLAAFGSTPALGAPAPIQVGSIAARLSRALRRLRPAPVQVSAEAELAQHDSRRFGFRRWWRRSTRSTQPIVAAPHTEPTSGAQPVADTVAIQPAPTPQSAIPMVIDGSVPLTRHDPDATEMLDTGVVATTPTTPATDWITAYDLDGLARGLAGEFPIAAVGIWALNRHLAERWGWLRPTAVPTPTPGLGMSIAAAIGGHELVAVINSPYPVSAVRKWAARQDIAELKHAVGGLLQAVERGEFGPSAANTAPASALRALAAHPIPQALLSDTMVTELAAWLGRQTAGEVATAVKSRVRGTRTRVLDPGTNSVPMDGALAHPSARQATRTEALVNEIGIAVADLDQLVGTPEWLARIPEPLDIDGLARAVTGNYPVGSVAAWAVRRYLWEWASWAADKALGRTAADPGIGALAIERIGGPELSAAVNGPTPVSSVRDWAGAQDPATLRRKVSGFLADVEAGTFAFPVSDHSLTERALRYVSAHDLSKALLSDTVFLGSAAWVARRLATEFGAGPTVFGRRPRHARVRHDGAVDRTVVPAAVVANPPVIETPTTPILAEYDIDGLAKALFSDYPVSSVASWALWQYGKYLAQWAFADNAMPVDELLSSRAVVVELIRRVGGDDLLAALAGQHPVTDVRDWALRQDVTTLRTRLAAVLRAVRTGEFALPTGVPTELAAAVAGHQITKALVSPLPVTRIAGFVVGQVTKELGGSIWRRVFGRASRPTVDGSRPYPAVAVANAPRTRSRHAVHREQWGEHVTVEIIEHDDPTMPPARKMPGQFAHASQRVFTNPVFGDVVGPADVRPGPPGESALLTALLDAAATRPGQVRELITVLGDDTFEVRFTAADGTAEYITVDRAFHTEPTTGEPLYAAIDDDQPLWAAIIEKAWASYLGGYAAAYETGTTVDFVAALGLA
ncbi:C2 family cysteine protease [Nocardia salmonicida]